MMKKAKYFILIFVGLGVLFFLGVAAFPENRQFQEILNSVSDSEKDIVVIFNTGGWGDTPFEKAKDFLPIAEGIQKTLNEWGYNSVVIPYIRAESDFSGKIASTREIIFSFPNQAEKLSVEINKFLKENPSKKIVVAGLSSGAAFADATIEKVSQDVKNRVYAVEIGNPFWRKRPVSENVLRLENDGGDPLSRGDMKVLVPNSFKALYKWILIKVSGGSPVLANLLHLSGHEYFWSDMESEITAFLEKKLK